MGLLLSNYKHVETKIEWNHGANSNQLYRPEGSLTGGKASPADTDGYRRLEMMIPRLGLILLVLWTRAVTTSTVALQADLILLIIMRGGVYKLTFAPPFIVRVLFMGHNLSMSYLMVKAKPSAQRSYGWMEKKTCAMIGSRYCNPLNGHISSVTRPQKIILQTLLQQTPVLCPYTIFFQLSTYPCIIKPISFSHHCND
jgi:hypothetical protein